MFAFVAMLLIFIPLPALAGEDFSVACEKLAGENDIRILFEDRPVLRDDSRSIEVLKRLSQLGANPYHSVLGLTQAEPLARLEVAPRMLTDGHGRVCGVAALSLTLGFSALQVYLASELRDDCRRRIVYEHEQEHVAVWRSHFRAGARMLEPVLRAKLGQPAYFNSQAEAREGLRQRAEALIEPLIKNLNDGIFANHRLIDSPASYQYTEGRLRACP